MLHPRRISTSGPKTARIALVGEAPGEDEENSGLPFMGAAGQELTVMLKEAGIVRSEVFLTNVLSIRPPGNKLDEFCGARNEVGRDYLLPPLSSGKYLRPEFLPELERLRAELEEVRPNVVVALGGTASWALLHAPKITTVRGTVSPGTLVPYKVLPTFHPAAVLRDWAKRPIVLADLLKAERESHFPEVRRPERTVYFDPTLKDLEEIEKILLRAAILGTDIETKLRTITCIGFAPSKYEAYVIPFWDSRKIHGSYWDTHEEEVEAWNMVERVLSSSVPKVFQNGLYDIQYILKAGLRIRNCYHDTMILHHAKYPELQKSLGFMGSIYTNEASWKLLRPRGEDSTKREDE